MEITPARDGIRSLAEGGRGAAAVRRLPPVSRISQTGELPARRTLRSTHLAAAPPATVYDPTRPPPPSPCVCRTVWGGLLSLTAPPTPQPATAGTAPPPPHMRAGASRRQGRCPSERGRRGREGGEGEGDPRRRAAGNLSPVDGTTERWDRRRVG